MHKFHEEEIKIYQVSRRHKSRYIKFLEEKIHMQQVLRTKKHASCFSKKKTNMQ